MEDDSMYSMGGVGGLLHLPQSSSQAASYLHQVCVSALIFSVIYGCLHVFFNPTHTHIHTLLPDVTRCLLLAPTEQTVPAPPGELTVDSGHVV